MVFSPSYLTDTSGDFYDVVHGTLTSKTTDCLWRDALTTTTSACNWPIPVSNTLTTIDDLWHAAVNGRGLYFSATDAGELKKGLGTALGGLNKDPNPGAQSPSANPNPQLSATDNFQFSTWFVTVDWYGELLRQEIDPVTGLVIEPGSKPPVVAANFSPLKPDPKTYVWSAQAELNKKVTSTGFASRNIYTNVNGNLTSFIWNQLGAAQANFTKPNISTGLTVPSTVAPLSQFCATPSVCLSATAQNAANVTVASGGAAGEALVNFLRGDTSKQEASGVSDTAKFYRYRAHVLGDIVTAKPVYVGTPDKGYGDTNYAAFADPTTNLLAKQPVVFAAANDGMLHAFDSANGNELWAYIPGLVLPKLYTLADKQYPLRHQFFVEGTPVVGDICPNAPSTPCQAGEWKTILVGGLSGGGTGYYALDITDPQKPKLLWELNDPNMGYSFGVPQITKLDDGTWVVLLTSGYDNCPFNSVSAPNCTKASPNGDGKGHLYVLKANGNAGAAQVIYDISTGSGTAASPSGLAQIMAHASVNNVSSVVYGADLDGKLWHFDISTQTPRAAKLMISLIDPVGNNPQPVTTAPQVTTLNGVTVVYVGTGRFLNINDSVSTSPQQQSIYGVKDISSKIPYGNPRVQTATTNFIVNTAVSVTCPTNTPPSICVPGQITRTVPPVANGDSLANHDGWVTDMPPIAGEIVINDPLLLFGTLFVTSNAPLVNNTTVCTKPGASSDGQGFLYMLDFKTGAGVGTNVAATSLGVGLFSGPQVVRTSDGRLIAVVRDQKGGQIQVEPRFNPAPATKRVSWRELINP
jgi:type IV pilus assembly protein PilY1